MNRGLKTFLTACALLPAAAFGQLRYDSEYPAIGYSTTTTTDRVSRLIGAIEAGDTELTYRPDGGYLSSLLEALDIDPSSQLLVFSKTARKKRFVTPETPRAIYFNDDTYVAFIPDTVSLELAAMDPNIGPVFFELAQDPQPEVPFERETTSCIRCHDTLTNTGGGYPRFFQNSVLVGPSGRIVSHEAGGITDTGTPLRERWGGWYVTGTHGEQEHLGNLIIRDTSVREIDLLANGNKRALDEYFDAGAYLSGTSDIVALLVIEHQIEVQNAMVKVHYDVETILDEEGAIDEARLAGIARPLLESLLMSNEIELTDPVSGVSGYGDYFESLGPFDAAGRSLRELNLETRTFEYPLSYLIYSGAFDALPGVVREHLSREIHGILTGENSDPAFSHLDDDRRRAILEILHETKPGFLPSRE